MVTHVLFDFDGTLVNSIDRIIEVAEDTVRKENPNVRLNDKIKGKTPFVYPNLPELIGFPFNSDYIPNLTSFQNLAKLINSELNLSLDPDTFAVFIGQEARLNLAFLPGVEKLIKHLYAQGIPMAVATGACSGNYNHGVSNNFPQFFATYISHAVCAFDDPGVANRKPAPDCYQVAAARFKEPPSNLSNVLIFEDSITGLKGATASGGRTVFVSKWKSMFSEENAPLIAKAELVIDSLEAFKPEQFGLPPFEA